MNTVFVPTDFSKSSIGGLALGAVIADETKSPLVLHHNVATLIDWRAQDRNEQFEHPQVLGSTLEAERLLNKLVNDAILNDLVVSKQITHGITADEIVRSARKHDASYIVMGSHGVEDAGRRFIGSTVQKVIRQSTIPVILVKRNTTRRPPRKIVFPFLFNEPVDKPFSEVRSLATQLGATIHLLFVNTPAKFKDTKSIRAEMTRFAEAYPDQNFVMDIYDHTDVVNGIIEHAKDIDADLIAMVSHDRLHQPQYLIGITETVVFHSEIPVLSVNARAFKPGFGPESAKAQTISAKELN
jgi:nucleotide-binding universal stress UspA family protein